MELEDRERSRVATVEAASATSSDELGLPAPPALLERAVRLRVALPSSGFESLFRVAFSRRRLRCVVRPERGAREAETAPIEPAQLPIDHDLSWKRSAAGRTGLLLACSNDRFAWTAKPTQRPARETHLATVEVEPTSIDHRVLSELVSAARARLHE